MTLLPPEIPDDRRATPGRRRGIQRRVGERRLEVIPVTLESRHGGERRQEADRRTGARRREEGSGPHNRTPVVMFVGEDPADARLLEGLLQKSTGESFELVTVARRAAALERVAQGNVDVVLLDLSFPRGLESFVALNTG